MTSVPQIPSFTNSYLTLPPVCYEAVESRGSRAPVMLAWNEKLASELGFSPEARDAESTLNLVSGNAVANNSQPIALAYAGHQFGHFSPQLGDGRALLLGQLADKSANPLDVQLKGSGRTPFSRGGDGRSALGPVIREYLVSEAMHALGVPTTRALAAVATGETVVRESVQPGGILTRVATSHLRVGSFEFFAARGAVDVVQALSDFAIQRLYPNCATYDQPTIAFYDAVVDAQARLVARWMSLGFIHGVMNTDNMTISGETIDYGPCAFMDEYEAGKVFSSIDHGGRYAYDQQPRVAQWNLARLADSLLTIDADQPAYEAILSEFPKRYQQYYLGFMRPKLGLLKAEDGDADLLAAWLTYLEQNALDFTNSFRDLSMQTDMVFPEGTPDVLRQWQERIGRETADKPSIVALMNAANPRFIPRNHRIEQAIQAANTGVLAPFDTLRKILAKPFDEQPDAAEFTQPPTAEERITETFCGT